MTAPTQLAADDSLPAAVVALATDPNDRRAAYALLANETLYRSLDQGQTWHKLPLPVEERPYIPADPTLPNEVSFAFQPDIQIADEIPGLLFVLAQRTLYRSQDSGETWQAIQDHVVAWTMAEIRTGAGPPVANLYVWRNGELPPEEQGLYISSGGDSWLQKHEGALTAGDETERVTTLAVDTTFTPFIVYAGTDGALYRSRDGGAGWQRFDASLPVSQGQLNRVLALFAVGPEVKVLTEHTSPTGTGEARYVLSQLTADGPRPDNDRWTTQALLSLAVPCTGTEQCRVFALVPDAERPNRLYLGTNQGLFVSRDNGQSWRAVPLPDGVTAVYRLASFAGDPGHFVLSTNQDLVMQTAGALARPDVTGIPALAVTFQFGGATNAVAVADEIVYLGVGPRLQTLDVTDPVRPQLIAQSDPLPGLVEAIHLDGDVAYLSLDKGGLLLVDVSDPADLRRLGHLPALEQMGRLALTPSLLAVADGASVRFVDIGNKTNLRETAVVPVPDAVQDVVILGSTAYAAYRSGVLVLDITDPATPREVDHWQLETPSSQSWLMRHDSRVHVLTSDWRLIDVSGPEAPRQLGQVSEPIFGVDAATTAGNVTYAASNFCEMGYCTSTMYLIDFTGTTPAVIIHEHVEDPDSPGAGGVGLPKILIRDAAVSGDFVYLAGVEGLAIVDVAEPTRPHVVGTYDTLGPVFGVVVDAGVAYLATIDVVIADITSLGQPQILSRIDAVGAAGLAVTDSYLVLPEWTDSVRLVDVSDPSLPHEVSLLSRDVLQSNTSEVAVVGETIYVNGLSDGLAIVDMSDPAQPQLVGRFDWNGRTDALAATGTHLFLAGHYEAATGAEVGLLRTLDLSRPAVPRQVGQVRLDGWGMDVAVMANLAIAAVVQPDCYETDCQGGVQTVDVSDPAKPRVVGELELGRTQAVALADDIAFAGVGTAVYAIDVSNPFEPTIIAHRDTPAQVAALTIAGEHLFIANNSGGLLIVQVP